MYAYGLRNPYRFSFDRQSGTIAIGDVGQVAREEIDLATVGEVRGANFGWDAYEASEPLELPDTCSGDTATPPMAGTTFPFHSYPHHSATTVGETGCAVVGGIVSHSAELPSLHGRYLYSDLCNGALRSFAADPDAPPVERGREARHPDRATDVDSERPG